MGLNECTKAFKELAINASLEPRLESKARSQVSNFDYQRVTDSENV